jgi:hypothetical protein
LYFLADIICLIKEDEIGWVSRRLGKKYKTDTDFYGKTRRKGTA